MLNDGNRIKLLSAHALTKLWPHLLFRTKMESTIKHLLWGVTLYSLFCLLSSMGMPLMRVSSALKPSQAYAISIIVEFFSFLPFVGVTKREWKINKCHEWIAFTVYGCGFAYSFAAVIYCSQNMPLGKFLFMKKWYLKSVATKKNSIS